MRANSKWLTMSCFTVGALLLHSFNIESSIVAQTKEQTAQPATQTGQSEGQRGDVYSSDYFTGTRPKGKNPTMNKSSFRDRLPTGKRRVLAKGIVYIKIDITLGHGRPATEREIKDSSIAKVPVCLERQNGVCIRSQEMVVERISDDTTVTQRTPIQMMIEYLASRDEAGTKQQPNRIGYLYVINRVQFPNGKTSPPKLIFPTKLTFGGGNVIVPGKPIMLPDPRKLWEISRNKVAIQSFETYIIIVSPQPLTDLMGKEILGDNLSATSLELDEELVRSWIRRWGGGEIPSDLMESMGRLFTQKEQSASGDPTMTSRDTAPMNSDLKEDDPQPQIAFRKALPPNGTMLITIKLPFRETVPTSEARP